MELTYDLTTPDGKTAEIIATVIRARGQELKQTTKQSCVALAINILRSLRAQTAVAKEGTTDILVTDRSNEFTPSFTRKTGKKGKKVSERCLRSGKNGSVVKPEKVVWRTGKYRKGENYRTFGIQETVGQGKKIEYLLVCQSESKALQYARKFAKSRIRRFKGLAKHAVGIAMKSVYDRQNVPATNITAEAKDLAAKVVVANVTEHGFDSGEVSIIVKDQLDYATCALKNGDSTINQTVNNALAKMAGLIAHRTANAGLRKSMLMTIEQLKQEI